MAIVKQSAGFCLNIFAHIHPNTYPNHGNPKPAMIIYTHTIYNIHILIDKDKSKMVKSIKSIEKVTVRY